jgi:hypothetical protein
VLAAEQVAQRQQRGCVLGRAPDERGHDVAVHLGQRVPRHTGVLDGLEDRLLRQRDARAGAIGADRSLLPAAAIGDDRDWITDPRAPRTALP